MVGIRSSFGGWHAAILATAVAATTGVLAVHLADASSELSAHWVFIGALALLSGGLALRETLGGRFFGPLGIISVATFGYFVSRPLQLALSAEELTSTYDYRASAIDRVFNLRGQEITLFLNERLTGSLDSALTRATGALLLFFVVFLIGYRAGWGRRLAARAAHVGERTPKLELRGVRTAWLSLGLATQLLLLAQIGGPGAAVAQLGTQQSLAGGFVTLVLLSFYTVGLIIWAAWLPPRSGAAKLAFVIAVAEAMALYSLLGSRTLVLIPLLLVAIVYNYTTRRIPLRVLVPVAVVGMLFFSSYLAVREATRTDPLTRVLPRVPGYALDVRGLLNTSPVFDQFLAASIYIPESSPYRYGGELLDGVSGQVPRVLYPGKPEPNDTAFRRLIWGDRLQAGRPIGLVGGLYRDLGFAGIALGAFLFGIAARGLTGLIERAETTSEGGRLRIALFAISVVVMYEFVVGGYSIAFGLAIQLLLPLLLAVKVFTRHATRPAPSAGAMSGKGPG